MSQSDVYSDGEYETVIAAAAYAVASLEEKEEQGSQKKKQRQSVQISGSSLPKTKSKIEDNKINLTSISGSFKRWFAVQEAEGDDKPLGDSFRKKSRREEELVPENLTASHSENSADGHSEYSTPSHSIEEKAMGRTPSVKKTPTFTDKRLNETGSKRIGSGKDMRPSLEAPPSAKKFPTSSSGSRRQDEYSADKSKADAWEKAKMIKIKNRYDSMMSIILEWETAKKAKAKSHMERKENAPDHVRRRARAKYEDEKSRIEKVAGEARALAEGRRRNDEAKARAKAEKIRSTGKIPKSCGCF